MAAYSPAPMVDTKLVVGPLLLSVSVPPTICFTWPSCRSMHGRNTLRRCCDAPAAPADGVSVDGIADVCAAAMIT
jgi:hypothetical protein